MNNAVERFIYRLRRAQGHTRRLECYGWKVFSQSDEDGIISEIFRRIGRTNKIFVEFGAEAGSEDNTRLLLETGWTGLWIEDLPEYSDIIQANFQVRISSGELTFVKRYVDRDNINELIRSAGISGEIDFLSIDIDSIDYYVFAAIDVIRPRVLRLEHNHSYPPPADWVMQCDTSYRWDPQSGRAEYGASLVAMTRLARQKGYQMVGCGLVFRQWVLRAVGSAQRQVFRPALAGAILQPAALRQDREFSPARRAACPGGRTIVAAISLAAHLVTVYVLAAGPQPLKVAPTVRLQARD